jgi:GT2 family glycosyltransferase
MRPELSIVLLSFNRLELTRTSVENLVWATRGLNREILVVDNASEDGTREYLKGLRKKGVRIIMNETNRYFGGGNNVGLDAAEGRHILLTQNDFTLSESSIPLLLRAARTLPDCGLVGVGGGLLDRNGQIFEVSYWWKNTLLDFHYLPVDFISGCCMLADLIFMREKNIRFDETYKLYWEDVDLSHQFMAAGKSLYMLNDGLARTSHIRSGTITPLLGEKARERMRGQSHRYYAKKWREFLHDPTRRVGRIDYRMFPDTFDAMSIPGISPERLRPPVTPELLALRRGRALMFPGEQLEMAGDINGARSFYQRQIRLNAGNQHARLGLARLAWNAGAHEWQIEACRDLETALATNPPEPLREEFILLYQRLLETIAVQQAAQKRFTEAVASWNRLMASARTEATRRYCVMKISAVHARQRRTEKASEKRRLTEQTRV